MTDTRTLTHGDVTVAALAALSTEQTSEALNTPTKSRHEPWSVRAHRTMWSTVIAHQLCGERTNRTRVFPCVSPVLPASLNHPDRSPRSPGCVPDSTFLHPPSHEVCTHTHPRRMHSRCVTLAEHAQRPQCPHSTSRFKFHCQQNTSRSSSLGRSSSSESDLCQDGLLQVGLLQPIILDYDSLAKVETRHPALDHQLPDGMAHYQVAHK